MFVLDPSWHHQVAMLGVVDTCAEVTDLLMHDTMAAPDTKR